MSHHKFLYVFVSFAVLALIILAISVYHSTTVVIPVILSNQTMTPTGYVVANNPCSPSQCYNEYCYDHGEVILNRVSEENNCVKREYLRCFNGNWFYDSTPQKVCY